MHMDDAEDVTQLGQMDFPSSMEIASSQSLNGIRSNRHHKRPSLYAALNGGVTRTCSGRLESNLSHSPTPSTIVLGESHQRLSGSLRNMVMSLTKMPKMPHPMRTASIFNALSHGLSECVSVTQEDINSLKESFEELSVNSQQSQGKLFELEKKLKIAERYLKRLEFHLAKVEELQDHYTLQQKLKDGIRSMAHAFILSPGREYESALSNVRYGFKECMESLCSVEAQLELLMGTLQFEMKGIQGFARLCSGDVFEICVRHGHQKWKSRGRVLKNKIQTWDSEGIVFKALLNEVLHIKAMEVKGLTKTVLVGNKYCDTKDLFCANSQIMTVNLNTSGSLKLSIVITWNPLDDTGKDVLLSQLVTKSSGFPMLKDGCSYTSIRNHSPYEDSGSLSSRHSSLSAGSATLNSASFDSSDFHERLTLCDAAEDKKNTSRLVPVVQLPLKSMTLDLMQLYLATNLNISADDHQQVCSTTETSTYDEDNDPTHEFQLFDSVDNRGSYSLDQGSSQGSHLDSTCSLPVMVNTLECSLKVLKGKYPELSELQLQMIELELLLRDDGRRVSHSSIESALECFDFLDTEVDEDKFHFMEDKSKEDDKSSHLDLTAQTCGDYDIKQCSLHITSPECSQSEVPATTSSEQLDLALATHLSQCLHLLENLGTLGPLKCREARALQKLKIQATIIARLTKLVSILKYNSGYLLFGLDELKDDVPLQQLWNYVTDKTGAPFCVGAEHCYQQLIHRCEETLQCKQSGDVSHLAEKVAHLLVTRILDSIHFDAETGITVHQFAHYFWENVSQSLEKQFEELADETILLEVLHSSNVDNILTVLHQLTKALHVPMPDCLQAIIALVVCDIRHLQQASIKYLVTVAKNMQFRSSIITRVLEGLESDEFVIRQASVAALAYLKADECIEMLIYIFQTDESVIVKKEAKSALMTFGKVISTSKSM